MCRVRGADPGVLWRLPSQAGTLVSVRCDTRITTMQWLHDRCVYIRSFLDNFGHLSDRDLSPLMMYPLHKVGTLLDPSVIEGSVAVQTLLKQRESPDLTLCGEEDLVTETSESCEQPKESCVKRLDSDKSPFPSDKSPTPAEEGPPHSTESPPHLLEDRSSSLPRAKKLKEDGKLAGAGVVVESDVEAMLTGAGVVVESDVEAMLTGAGVVVESDVEAMLTGTGVVVESDVEAMLTGAGTHITHPITQSAEAGAQIAVSICCITLLMVSIYFY